MILQGVWCLWTLVFNIYVPDTSIFVSSYVWSGLGLVKVGWPILQWSPQTKCFATVFSEDLLWQVLLCALASSGRGSRVASLLCKVILGTFISKFQRCFKPRLLFPREVPNWKTIYKGKAEERELRDGKGYVGVEVGIQVCFYGNKNFFSWSNKDMANEREKARFYSWWLKHSSNSASCILHETITGWNTNIIMGTEDKESGPSIPAVTERHHIPFSSAGSLLRKVGQRQQKGGQWSSVTGMQLTYMAVSWQKATFQP